MKKLISLLTAIVCCGLFTIGISAETITKSFNMASTTGIYEGEASLTYNFVNLTLGQSENETITISTPPEITSIALEISGSKSITNAVKRETKDTFYFIKSANSNDFYLNILANSTKIIRDGELCLSFYDEIDTISLKFTASGKTADYTIYDKIVTDKSFAVKFGAISVTADNTLANLIYGCINANPNIIMNVTKAYTEYDYPVLTTTGGLVQNRFAITKLSDRWGNGGVYAGFASQVADFFDGQTNGKIIFEIAGGKEEIVNGWANSTLTAPTTFLSTSEINTEDIVLFFNYNTTGSIAVSADIDTGSNTITFDISRVLDDFGGLTKANLEDIYYGLCTAYGADNGIAVKNVILSYDNEEAATTTTTELTEIISVETVEDDAELDDFEDDTVFIPADEDGWLDAVVIEDIDNEVDEDINPPTGVDIGLCGFGVIFSAIGIILAKKRK